MYYPGDTFDDHAELVLLVQEIDRLSPKGLCDDFLIALIAHNTQDYKKIREFLLFLEDRAKHCLTRATICIYLGNCEDLDFLITVAQWFKQKGILSLLPDPSLSFFPHCDKNTFLTDLETLYQLIAETPLDMRVFLRSFSEGSIYSAESLIFVLSELKKSSIILPKEHYKQLLNREKLLPALAAIITFSKESLTAGNIDFLTKLIASLPAQLPQRIAVGLCQDFLASYGQEALLQNSEEFASFFKNILDTVSFTGCPSFTEVKLINLWPLRDTLKTLRDDRSPDQCAEQLIKIALQREFSAQKLSFECPSPLLLSRSSSEGSDQPVKKSRQI